MTIDDGKLKNTRDEAKEFYSTIGKIKCPYLNKEVSFNNEGFEHLLTRKWNCGRSSVEQYTRLRLLPKAVEVVKKSHTLQEYNKRKIFVRQKINSRWEKRLKNVEYFVFIALYPGAGVRFKVIVKCIEGGEPFFWGVYPSWKKVVSNGNSQKIMYTGNLEED